MTSEIKTCENQNCVSEYQDRKYGKGKRVHNLSGGVNKKTGKCTVCGTKK